MMILSDTLPKGLELNKNVKIKIVKPSTFVLEKYLIGNDDEKARNVD